jgi:hypothetical protein
VREPSQPVRGGIAREPSQPVRGGIAREPSQPTQRLGSDVGMSPGAGASATDDDTDLPNDGVLGATQNPLVPSLRANVDPDARRASAVPRTEAANLGDAAAEQPPRRISSPSTGVPEPLRREDSGLRMIGSLGRDRAEASGEVVPIRPPPEPAEPPREVVTILPRRITREMPIVQPPPGTEPATSPPPIPPAAPPPPPLPEAPATAAPPSSAAPPPAAPVEMPRPLPPPARISMEGSGVRRKTGSGLGALVLLALAALFAAIAVYIRIRKSPTKHEPAAVLVDAGTAAAPDAFRLASPSIDAAMPDAPRVASAADAGPGDGAPRVVDAGSSDAVFATTVDASAETRVQQAKLLVEKAYAAMEEGRFQQALDLVDESLKLRRAARTLLLRAQALQRLDQIDDSLTAISEANLLYLQSEGKDFAAGWQEKGKILWAAGRYSEAKTAYEHFLELEPTGPAAAEARRRLGEPR